MKTTLLYLATSTEVANALADKLNGAFDLFRRCSKAVRDQLLSEGLDVGDAHARSGSSAAYNNQPAVRVTAEGHDVATVVRGLVQAADDLKWSVCPVGVADESVSVTEGELELAQSQIDEEAAPKPKSSMCTVLEKLSSLCPAAVLGRVSNRHVTCFDANGRRL